MAADDGTNTRPAFVVVQVQVAPGSRVDVNAQPTAHPDLLIAPSVRINAAEEPVFDGGRLMLVQASTGHRVAAADTAQVLAELARQLAWFNQDLLDPAYLTAMGNEGLLASVAELFRYWRADVADTGLPSHIKLVHNASRRPATPMRSHVGRNGAAVAPKSLRRRPPESIASV